MQRLVFFNLVENVHEELAYFLDVIHVGAPGLVYAVHEAAAHHEVDVDTANLMVRAVPRNGVIGEIEVVFGKQAKHKVRNGDKGVAAGGLICAVLIVALVLHAVMRFELAAKLVGKLPSPLLKREALLRGIKQALLLDEPPIGFHGKPKVGYELFFLIPKPLKHGNHIGGRRAMSKLGFHGIKQAHPVHIMTVRELGTCTVELEVHVLNVQLGSEDFRPVHEGLHHKPGSVLIRNGEVVGHLVEVANRDLFPEGTVELFLALGHDCRMLRYRGGDVARELVEGFLIDSIVIACDAAQVVVAIKCKRLNVILGRDTIKQLLDLQNLAGHAVCLNDFFGEILRTHPALESFRVGVVEFHMNEVDEITHAACLDTRPHALLVIQVNIRKRAIEY